MHHAPCSPSLVPLGRAGDHGAIAVSHPATAGGLAILRSAVAALPDGEMLPFPEGARLSTPVDSFLALLGMVPLRVGRWLAEARMPITSVHRGQEGELSGAALAAFADAVAGWATFAVLGADIGFTTAVLTAAPVETGAAAAATLVHGRAELLHEGQRTVVLAVDVRVGSRDGALVSRTVCTQVLLADGLPPRPATC